MTPRAFDSGGRMTFTPARLGGIQLQRRTDFKERISLPRCPRKRRLKSKGKSRLPRSTCTTTQAADNAHLRLSRAFNRSQDIYLKQDGFLKDLKAAFPSASMISMLGWDASQEGLMQLPMPQAHGQAHKSTTQANRLDKVDPYIALVSIME